MVLEIWSCERNYTQESNQNPTRGPASWSGSLFLYNQAGSNIVQPAELEKRSATILIMVKWNEVTWYSKLGAIILFTGIVPALCFYIGTQYELTQQSLYKPPAQNKVTEVTLLNSKIPKSPSTVDIGPDQISSINVSDNTFATSPFTYSAPSFNYFKVSSTTTIRTGNQILKLSNLAVNDYVWVRATFSGKDRTYIAQEIIDNASQRGSKAIIKEINTSENTVTVEEVLPPQNKNNIVTLSITSETLMTKGPPNMTNRPLVTLTELKVGDVANISEVGSGINTGQFKWIVTSIDIPNPFPCALYLSPPGCVKP